MKSYTNHEAKKLLESGVVEYMFTNKPGYTKDRWIFRDGSIMLVEFTDDPSDDDYFDDDILVLTEDWEFFTDPEYMSFKQLDLFDNNDYICKRY